MKRISSLLLTFVLLISFAIQGFSQCTPDQQYLSDTLGFYPEVSEDCGFTFSSEAERTVEIIGVGNVTFYLDAFRITEILNLPVGITATTDVIGTVDIDGPYGYWFNGGAVPSMSEVVGCVNFEESGTTFSSLVNGGPNSDGNFPITVKLDARIAGSNPDISFVIANGTWLSNVPANVGGGLLEYDRNFNVNSCLASGPCTPPTVLFAGLNTSYTIADAPSSLIGAPAGGTFYGAGISGSTFDPSIAGVGTHGITYVYTDNQNCTNAYSLCTTVNLNVSNGPENEITNNGNINVYPNPSSGKFELSIQDIDGVVSYSVYDALGKEVVNEVFVASGKTNRQIDLSELESGSYTLQVNTGKGVFSDQLIKQ